jgi:S1-C subfamily serine protease
LTLAQLRTTAPQADPSAPRADETTPKPDADVVAPRTDNDQIAEQAVAPADRPNQIAVRDLAARLGMELRAAANGQVLVSAVHPDSSAAALAIRPGDVLTSIERQAITAQVAAVNIIAADNPEKKIAFTFMREGKPIALTTAFPDRAVRTKAPPAPAVSPRTPQVALFGLTAIENAQGQVVVAQVTPGSAAALAGVSPDDVLLKVDDADVTSLQRFAAVAATETKAKAAGDRATIDALRDGSDQTFVLILRETDFVESPPAPTAARAPLAPGGPSAPAAPTAPNANNPNQQVVFCMQLRRLASGSVVVVDVAPGSPAALAGIRPGDALASVAGEKIDSLAEIADVIGRQREGEIVEFGVVRADQLGSFQVKMLPCENKPTVASGPAGAPPNDASGVDELRTQVRSLQTQVDELSQAVKTLTTAVRALQNPQ